MLSTVLMMPLVSIGGEDKALGFEGASRCCR